MAHYRTRKETINYKKYMRQRKKQGKDDDCIFCEVVPGFPQFVKELKHFKIIRNIFMYSSWDGQAVSEHLLLVPHKHVNSLAHLSKAAALEYFDTVTAYEEKGYHVYARGSGTSTKTIVHQHTHLIRPAGKHHKLVIFLAKPYMRIVR